MTPLATMLARFDAAGLEAEMTPDGEILAQAPGEPPSDRSVRVFLDADGVVRVTSSIVDEWDIAAALGIRNSAAQAMAQRIVPRSKLKYFPKPRPLIDGMLFRGTAAGLFAGAGVGKSSLAIDWCSSLSLGRDWNGRTCHRSKVLYCAGEGREGLDQRLTAWERHNDAQIDDDWFSIYPAAIDLGRSDDVTEMAEVIRAGSYQMIVIDTLARSMPGLDENSSRDMGVAVKALDRLLDATPARSGTVLVLHHHGKDNKTVRGSSALTGALDTVFDLKGGPAKLTLTATKQRETVTGESVQLRLVGVEDSVVIDVPEGNVRGQIEGPRDEELLSVLMSDFGGGPVMMVDLRRAAGQANSTFDRVLKKLVRDGRVENIGDEKHQKLLAVGC